MASGYTYGVQSGEVTEFRDFAMRCARAFGALIEMRDSPPDAPIPREFAPSSYHAEKIQEAALKIAALEEMDRSDMEDAAAQEYAEHLRRYNERRAQRRVHCQRYEAMLAQVKAWEPPTTDHAEMKKFMRDQLTESMKWDCDGSYDEAPERLSGPVWHTEALSKAHKSLAYHREESEKERERCAARNKWVRDLRESLEPTATTTGA
jgi:hypothetical protein